MEKGFKDIGTIFHAVIVRGYGWMKMIVLISGTRQAATKLWW